MPKDEEGTPRLAPSGVSVISVTARSSSTGISPKSSAASWALISGNAAEAAAALRAKGSSQEGILISSESRMDFDGTAEIFGVTGRRRRWCLYWFCGFKSVSDLRRSKRYDGVAFSEAGDEFGAPDCGADG